MIARIIQTTVAAAIVASAVFCRAAEDSVAPPHNQTLLLRNGEAVVGRISRDGDFYVVDLSNGQIRLKESEVELVCDGLEDGYRRKRALIQVGNVHHHLDLAQWCIRHELFGHAAVELADAVDADPDNPKIRLLRHRLKMAMEPPPAPETEIHSTPGPSNVELDRLIRGLPYKAVENFTQSVQPVLMNNCLGSGCHGPTSDVPMPLFRVSKDKSPTRRTTQRNLFAVLQYIDRENPLESRLVKACTGPHGSAKNGVFNERQGEQFQRLLLWTLMFAGQPAAQTPETVSTPGQSSGKTAAQAAPPPSSDPFDPEVFNRRFAPEEKKK